MPDTTKDKKPKSKAKSAKDDAILETSKARFKTCEEAERELRALALDDLKFRAGEQWPPEIKQRMMAERKPALTINVLPARERQILNEQRQNRPAIQVSPVGDGADVDTAEIFQGVIRHIEYDSDSDVAQDTAAASATRIGFGFLRLITDYENPESFEQVIKIKRIRNAFTVYLDPSAQEADRSDAKFGFIFTTLTKDEFKNEYPKAELASIDDWDSIGAHDADWISEEGIRIVEYFYCEDEDDELLEVVARGGKSTTVLASEFDQLSAAQQKQLRIRRRRATTTTSVKWCKHSATEILEETDWQGKWVPIIPVYGDELDVDGHLILEGMVRHAKDPMRMQNYMASKEVQAIALAPNAPFVAASGQIENHPEWQSANIDTPSVLTYEPISVSGTVVGAPQRQVAEPAIQAISQARLQFSDDLKAVTGIYDAQLGARSNEQSGKAILQRKTQGELSNYHYLDNLTRAQKFLGRQLLDLIPKIYSGPRVMRIVAPDGTAKMVPVNQKFTKGGVEKIYDLTAGRYDVTVESGPGYHTKRQEAVQSMLSLVESEPTLMSIIGDLLVRNMDWPGSKEIADRLKKMLPAQLQDENDDDPEAKAQRAQSQLQAMTVQHEQLTAALNQANEVINTKQVEAQGKLEGERIKAETQLSIEKLKVEAQITVAEINTKAQESQVRMKLEQDLWIQLHGDAHDLGMQKDQQAHEATQAAAAQQAASVSQQDAQAHEADQATQAQQAAAEQASATADQNAPAES